MLLYPHFTYDIQVFSCLKNTLVALKILQVLWICKPDKQQQKGKKNMVMPKRMALACWVLGIAKIESRSSVVDTPTALFHRDHDKECKKAKLL